MKPRLITLVLVAMLLVTVSGIAAYWLNLDPPAPPAKPEFLPAWVYESPDAGGFVAAPWVDGDTIFASTVLARGLRLGGSVEAIDPRTRERKWVFHAERAMKPTASAPVRAGDRIYFGEGMHANFVCQFYCLDATTGQPLWTFTTGDHVESTATVHGGLVTFAAGNDGVYSLDAATGGLRARFAADLHIDASPCVTPGGRVVVGSGPSRRFTALEIVALDVGTLKLLWRTPVELPAWGSPRAADGRIFVGLGNGRMTTPAAPPEAPAGALLALDEASGHELWRVRTPDAVFQRPTEAEGRVYFGCRDGLVRVVDAADGSAVWSADLGGPVIAPPAVSARHVLAVTQLGRFVVLDRATGALLAEYDLAARTGLVPLAVAAPRMVGDGVVLAVELEGPAGRTASLYYFNLESIR